VSSHLPFVEMGSFRNRGSWLTFFSLIAMMMCQVAAKSFEPSSSSSSSTVAPMSTSSTSTSNGPAFTLPEISNDRGSDYLDLLIDHPVCPQDGDLMWDGIQWQMVHPVQLRIVAATHVFQSGFIVVKTHLVISGTKIKLASSSSTLRYGYELDRQLIQIASFEPILMSNSYGVSFARTAGYLPLSTAEEGTIRADIIVEVYEGNFRYSS
jgi:hypothetical protein